MKQQAASLTAAERQAIAQWLGGNAPVSIDTSHVSNACKAPAPAFTEKMFAWSSWGGGPENWRFQAPNKPGLMSPQCPTSK